MPNFLPLIRSLVAVADGMTKSLQADVVFEKYIGQTGSGKKAYGSPTSLKASVDWKQRQVRTVTGILSVSRAAVQFTDIAKLTAATSGDGIDDNDKITLPDGTTGPILDMGGFIDAGTGRPFATEVFLG